MDWSLLVDKQTKMLASSTFVAWLLLCVACNNQAKEQPISLAAGTPRASDASLVAVAQASPSAAASNTSISSPAATNVPAYVATYKALLRDKVDYDDPAWSTAGAMEGAALNAIATLPPRTPGAPISPPSPTWDVRITDDSCPPTGKRSSFFALSCRVFVWHEQHCSISAATHDEQDGTTGFYFRTWEPCVVGSNQKRWYRLPNNWIPSGTDNLRIVSIIGSRVNLAPYVFIHQGDEMINPTVDARADNPNIIASFDMATHQFIVQGTPVAVTPIVVTPIVVDQYRELVSPVVATPQQ